MNRYLLILIILTSFYIDVKAGDELVSSKRPKVWENAALNTVVLEYTLTGSKLNKFSEVGEELSLLLHRNLLYSVIQYGPVGANQIKLNGTQEQNMPDNIFKKLLGELPGASQTVKQGNVLVFLWGRIFEDGNDIYIQSFLRFVRNGIKERFNWDIKDYNGKNLQLMGDLPTQAIAFAPRKLSTQTLQNINSEFYKNAIVRSTPDTNATGYPVSRDFLQSNAYQILSYKEGWMEIKHYRSNKKGWVRTGVNILEQDIRNYLPELYFAEAVAGYLRFLTSIDGSRWWSVSPQNIFEAIKRFEQAGKFMQLNETPLAILKIIQSHIYHLTSTRSPLEIVNLLKEASTIIPSNANAANLRICSEIYSGYEVGWKKKQLNEWNSRLIYTLSTSPDNYSIINNLESYYQLAYSYPDTGLAMSKTDIESKLEKVSKIRSAAEK